MVCCVWCVVVCVVCACVVLCAEARSVGRWLLVRCYGGTYVRVILDHYWFPVSLDLSTCESALVSQGVG